MEIKYRAWDGKQYYYSDDKNQFPEEWIFYRFTFRHKLIKEQSFGYPDKNDKKVFAGDILNPGLREVRFGEYFGVMGMGTGFYTVSHEEGAYPSSFGMTHRQVDESEVIGNIYQNPELLEESCR